MVLFSYGSVLATFKDQIENNLIGEYVNEGVTNADDYKSYWIGKYSKCSKILNAYSFCSLIRCLCFSFYEQLKFRAQLS